MGFWERRIWELMKAWREARGTEKQMLCQSSHECKSVCAERIWCMTPISTLRSTAKGIFHVRCHWSSRLLAYQSLSQPSYAGVTSVLTWPRISLWHVPMIRQQLHFEHGIDLLAPFEHFSLCLAMLWIVVIGRRENRLKAAATASWMRIPRSIQACNALKCSTKKAVRSVAVALISFRLFQ